MNTHTKMLPEYKVEDLVDWAKRVLAEADKPDKNIATIAALGTVLAEITVKALQSAPKTETEICCRSKEADKGVVTDKTV